MFKVSNVFLTLLISFLFLANGISQAPPVILNHFDESNSNKTHIASNWIDFLPGYEFEANTTAPPSSIQKEMEAYIDNYTTPFFDTPFANLDLNRPINKAKSVGSIMGRPSVNQTGGFTYSIPITVPVGTKGMIPQLSINYNSQSANGILGPGWSLSELRSISRTTPTIYHNFKDKGVKLNNQDIFTLLGNRCIALSGQPNGGNGTEYRTREETYSKIVSHGVEGSGPQWFEVTKKNGLTYHFGNSADSRVKPASGSTVLSWMISKIEDQNGNYILYEYDTQDDETVLTKISYTGNSITGRAPYNEILFVYGEKEDKQRIRIAGTYTNNKSVLKEIIISSEGTMVNKYELDYFFNINSYLREITLTGSDNKSYNSTVFQYGDFANEIKPLYTSANLPVNAEYRNGDYNGDGISDLIGFTYSFPGGIKTYNAMKLFINDGNGNFTETYSNNSLPANFFPFDPQNPSSQLTKQSMGIESFDLNGDGLDDILIGEITGPFYVYRAYFSNGTGLYDSGQFLQVGFDHVFTIGDFNGDNLLDAFAYRKDIDLWSVHFFDIDETELGNSFNELGGGAVSTQFLDADQIRPMNFTHDGSTELFARRGIDGIVLEVDVTDIFDGMGQPIGRAVELNEVYNDPYPGLNQFLTSGDLNGDGLTDFINGTGSSTITNWWVGYADEQAFDVSPLNIGLSNLFRDSSGIKVVNRFVKRGIADINGDGKADVFEFIKGIHDILNVYYSDGDSFWPQSYYLDFHFDYQNTFFTIGDFDGDGSNDFMIQDDAQIQIVSANQSVKSFFITGILDGYNNKTEVTYLPMSEGGSFYTKGSSGNYPITDVQVSAYLVHEVKAPNPNGGQNISAYSYSGAKMHRQGLGFLGFETVTQESASSNQKIATTYGNDPDFFNLFVEGVDVSVLSSGQQLESKIYTHEITDLGQNRFKSEIIGESITDHITGASTISTYTFDVYGNQTSRITSSGGTMSINNSSSFAQHGSWIPDKLVSTTITSQRTGKSALIKTFNNSYDSKGNLLSEVDFVGSGVEKTLTFSYHLDGNIATEDVTGTGVNPRSTAFTYDPNGRLIVSTLHGNGEVYGAEYDFKWGLPLKEIDLSGLENEYIYDGFGRLKEFIDVDGTSSATSRSWLATDPTFPSTSTEVNDGLFKISSTIDGGPAQSLVYNSIGLLRLEETQLVNGFSRKITSYLDNANVESVTSPHLDGDNDILVAVYLYDDLQRLTSVSDDARATTYNYTTTGSGYEVTTNYPDGTSVINSYDQSNKIVNVVNTSGNLEHDYDSDGNLISSKLDGTTLVARSYDELGNEIQMTDVNSGTVTREFDAYGRLTSETDNAGQTTSLIYNYNDQIFAKTTVEGTFLYEYYTTTIHKTLLKKITAPNGYTKEYTYDGMRRLSTVSEKIDATTFVTSYEYNANSQISSVTYPSGYQVKNAYTNGTLVQITNDDGTQIIWELTDQNAFGSFTEYNLGDGHTVSKTINKYGFVESINNGSTFEMTFDFDIENGNLLSREDVNKGLIENFDYDNLDRLTQSQVVGSSAINIAYSNNGNITDKTDVGSYTYDINKINAVVQVTDPNLLQQVVTFNSNKKPISILEGDHEFQFNYGAEGSRKKVEQSFQGSLSQSTYYLGQYERIVSGADVKEVHYIYAGTDLVSIYHSDNGTGNYSYTYTDYLGSILQLTDENGNIEYEQNFDPWGRFRNANDWSYNVTAVAPWFLTRGFTGEEHISEVGLINLNARLYDPAVGRMLSPDNFIQDVLNSQSFNRYSYGFNNPLKYSDPDGEFAVIASMLIGAAVGAAISGATYAVTVLVTDAQWDGQAFARSVAFGALGGAISGVFGGFSSVIGLSQNFTYNFLTNTAANFAVNLAQGNEVAATDLVGYFIGGVLGAAYGNYSGVGNASKKLNGVVNGFLEISYGAVKGAVVNGFAGSINTALRGGDPEEGFLTGARSGAISGGTTATLSIVTMGAAYKPDKEYGNFGHFKPVYRRGPIIVRRLIAGSGVIIGRNLITNRIPSGKYEGPFTPAGTSYKFKTAEEYNSFLRGHETGHFTQIHDMGFGDFYAEIFKLYFISPGFKKAYTTPGTLEWGANQYSATQHGLPWKP